MIPVCYVIACLAFAISFTKLAVVARLRDLMRIFSSARGVVGNPDLSDLEKEQKIRSLAGASIGAFASILLRMAGVVVATIVPVVAVAAMTDVNTDELVAFSLNPMVLATTVVAAIIIHRIYARMAG